MIRAESYLPHRQPRYHPSVPLPGLFISFYKEQTPIRLLLDTTSPAGGVNRSKCPQDPGLFKLPPPGSRTVKKNHEPLDLAPRGLATESDSRLPPSPRIPVVCLKTLSMNELATILGIYEPFRCRRRAPSPPKNHQHREGVQSGRRKPGRPGPSPPPGGSRRPNRARGGFGTGPAR